ncbi:hypothetical protein J8L98_18765 [Pseudoalteromonas sp. MMG013]|uniref:hypothetical protein n=1 Tax=Pseudoalteromonas sp. MMG013 TaxID=2822687 RepID=UPI001B36E1C9|nr:hypothetical protein [Pseudoalteromonas sp. MMG013]MBQ4863728.1 hypothetical protein [Pseudoalteromonas sp. MMG013]
MSYFFLLPAYWLCGILLYGASPRQQFRTENQKTPTRMVSLLYASILIIVTIATLMFFELSFFIAVLYTVCFAMFFIPAAVFLLAHKPTWIWSSLISVIVLSAFFQLLGARYVA